MSDITRKYRKKRDTFFWLSTLLWLGAAGFYAIMALKAGITKTGGDSGLGTYLVSMATTLLIAIGLTIVIKDKVRNTIWMASVILGSIVFGETGMYITFALWALDEFIIYALYKKYKLKTIINKEIDER